MRQKLFGILIFLFFFSCIRNSELKIIPIEDSYATKNGETPIKNYFFVQNFKDDKESITHFFSFIKKNKSLLNIGINYILDETDSIEFEDGTVNIDKNPLYYFLIDIDDFNYYKEITVSGNDKISTYDFHKKNTLQYITNSNQNITSISFKFDKFNIRVLQNFLNIVSFERLKTKRKMGNYSFQLINSNKVSDKIECEITFFNNRKRNLENVFEIKFP